ncbi:MAG TPA: N-6 DNA methylase [Alphaproteobacteria bacterium]|nr:N-6 DNA methylase [Alphaproteobacteria bacterium]
MTKHNSESRTEDVVMDLLDIQGWPLDRPPRGCIIIKNEYKSFREFDEILKGRSKTGSGDAYPDFLVVSPKTNHPLMVIETKADDFEKANKEACFDYGEAFREAGHQIIAIGVAGQEKTAIRVGVSKFHNGRWERICYGSTPISWIPTLDDAEKLVSSRELVDLAPVIPRPEILADKADLINRILREASVKDEFRPAYVGAIMLAMWQSHGNLRRNPENILSDINIACRDAFSLAGKNELSSSLYVDEANEKLAASAWQIVSTLEKLNVVTTHIAHDYLGQLYETFFQYTGGNTIGQYFTPRHIARLMADVCEVTKDDIVIDPACGTGGFLISCLQRDVESLKVKYEDCVDVVRNKLIGYESEPVTAALCVANMILRGDGKTGIRRDNCFTAGDYPVGTCQVALMNPPFPHKKTDVPPQKFVERALEALDVRGKLAVILPTSLTVKKDIGVWRKRILSNNTLIGVCQLPDELFQPYASSTTSVITLEKGIPHNPNRTSAFVRIQYDGLTLKKGARVKRLDEKNQIPEAIDAILNKKEIPGFSGMASLSGRAEWSPGAYIPSSDHTEDELKESIDELLRRLGSFYIRYAKEVATQREKIATGDLVAAPYRDIIGNRRLNNASGLPSNPGTIGELFDIYYGQKELHSRDGIPTGDTLIVSPTEGYNGCYGWLDYSNLIMAPFITVAQTGTIGEAFVQLEPCGVNDDCLILIPKEGHDLPLSCFFIAAAVMRLERWRFNYGRKLTPPRICDFKMSRMLDLEKWVDNEFHKWDEIINLAINNYCGYSDDG